VGAHNQDGAGVLPDQGRKSASMLASSLAFTTSKRTPAMSDAAVCAFRISAWVFAGRVDEKRNQCGRGNQLMQQFQTSRGRFDA
jgi:hypothetical protein